MRVLFAAYRDWAVKVVRTLGSHPNVTARWLATSIEELEDVVCNSGEEWDLVILCGWSWQVSQDLLSRVTVVSEHPAYLDDYSLGTPLQNQIVDGIGRTLHRVVKIGWPELGERLYSPKHEVTMSLAGNMDDILLQMHDTAITIYTKFLTDWPNVTWKQWPKAKSYAHPRKPAESELIRRDLANMTVRQIYDKVRMLEHPYPNAFIQDEHGTLYFERVRYVPK